MPNGKGRCGVGGVLLCQMNNLAKNIKKDRIVDGTKRDGRGEGGEEG